MIQATADSHFDLLEPAAIKASLATLGLAEYHLLYQRQTQSTNTDVIQYYQQTGRRAIATCETQTAGKGRRGRQWVSPFAQNIYCTVGMLKSLPSAKLSLLSIVSGMALCRALASCGVENVQLKWPNDLVYQEGDQKYKLGGLLIESKPWENGYFLAIGFGLNLYMTQADLNAIPQPVTSLSQIATKTLERQTILLAAIAAVTRSIHQFNAAKAKLLPTEFNRYDAFYAQPICVFNADKQISGRNAGIDNHGQLLLQTAQGLLSFAAAEISLRAMP